MTPCQNFALPSSIERKIERWHKSLIGECIRPGTPLSLEDARRLVQGYVEHYNKRPTQQRTGYITPKDMLAGRQQEIHAERDQKLEAARKLRQSRREGRVRTKEGQSQSGASSRCGPNCRRADYPLKAGIGEGKRVY